MTQQDLSRESKSRMERFIVSRYGHHVRRLGADDDDDDDDGDMVPVLYCGGRALIFWEEMRNASLSDSFFFFVGINTNSLK